MTYIMFAAIYKPSNAAFRRASPIGGLLVCYHFVAPSLTAATLFFSFSHFCRSTQLASIAAIIVIVSGSDGRMETLLEPAM